MTIMTVHVDPENALLFQVMSTNLEGVEFPLLRIRYQPLGTTTASQGSSVWVAGLVNSPVQLNIPAGPSQEHSITSPLSQILVDGQLMRVMEMVFLSPSVTFQDRLAVKAMINQERIAGLRDTTVWMFELDSEPSRRGSLLPIANAIKHCGGLIENLAMRVPCPMFPELISATKNLKKLRVESSSMILPDNNKSGKGSDFYKIEQLLTNNPDIQQLDLEGFEGGPDVSRILQRLTRVCPHLQELRLRNLRFDFRALIVLLLHSPRLRTLTAQECGITGNTRGGPERKERFPATAPMFKTLEALNVRGIVGLSIMGLLDWAGQCPRLRTLTIARPSSSFDRKTFRFTALRRCTRLSKVVFDGKSLTDIELADMIVNCPQLTALSPFRGHFGIDSFSSLMFIFQNITTLELFDSHMNTAMIHMILFSCENLEVFTCDELNADIDLRTVTVERLLQDGKPLSPSSSSARDYHQGKEGYHSCKITSNRWICSGLRVFKVKTLIWSLDIARNLLLAEHIASLRRLEDFVLGQIAHSIRPEDDRDIAIYAEGMTEGLRLKKGVFDRVQLETDPDLEWMLVSWPKLRHFQRCA
ncbi:hypothetical protein BGZ83_011486 [Gryganskiella cystojenkinii]|nr:hypothetical protein BGZ83_011486 [Gryganskiella cystojenkinii]